MIDEMRRSYRSMAHGAHTCSALPTPCTSPRCTADSARTVCVWRRSMFTINVGPQRITFMVGGGPQWDFIKQKDEVLERTTTTIVYILVVP